MAVKRMVGALVVGAGLMFATPASAQTAAARSQRPVTAGHAWQADVIDQGEVTYPASVQVVGDGAAVSDRDGLRAPGGAATTIRSTGVGRPRLVLDLGLNVGGIVEVGI